MLCLSGADFVRLPIGQNRRVQPCAIGRLRVPHSKQLWQVCPEYDPFHLKLEAGNRAVLLHAEGNCITHVCQEGFWSPSDTRTLCCALPEGKDVASKSSRLRRKGQSPSDQLARSRAQALWDVLPCKR